jgi:hypothetical protein
LKALFKEIEEESKVEEETKDKGEALARPFRRPRARLSNARRGKRRASESDVDVALKDERLKALKNEGTCVSNLSLVSFNSASIIPNLESLGSMKNSRVEALLDGAGVIFLVIRRMMFWNQRKKN